MRNKREPLPVMIDYENKEVNMHLQLQRFMPYIGLCLWHCGHILSHAQCPSTFRWGFMLMTGTSLQDLLTNFFLIFILRDCDCPDLCKIARKPAWAEDDHMSSPSVSHVHKHSVVEISFSKKWFVKQLLNLAVCNCYIYSVMIITDCLVQWIL